MPSLSSPMELSMPPVVSTVRGGGLPSRLLVIVFGRMPPSVTRHEAGHLPRVPNVPDATVSDWPAAAA